MLMTPQTPPPADNATTPTRVSKLARRPHRKSRNGCFNCKRRKVKCDEVKPACSNCIRFGIPCDFAPHSTSGEDAPVRTIISDGVGAHAPGEPAVVQRRGPGRPRKDWAALARTPVASHTAQQAAVLSTSPSSTVTMSESPSTIVDHAGCSINVADAELLLQFVYKTAATLNGTDGGTQLDFGGDGSIESFWARNVPMIGLSYHFVLHLIYAVAGYHLAYLGAEGDARRAEHLAVAEHHGALGLSELNKVLPNLDGENCGALYVSAVLVCYCTFAAGPTGPDDLLLCNVGEGTAQPWLPLIHGVRLIRQSIEPARLFTGLMEPLGPRSSPEVPDTKPAYLSLGLPRLDWVEAVDKLRHWISSEPNPNTILYQRALQGVAELYEAIYGNNHGVNEGPSYNQFVFGWLYRMQDPFVACLRRKEPQALLVLAYWAPLLNTLKASWFVEGWTRHLLEAIWRLVGDEYVSWLEWPLEASRQAA